MGGPPPRPLSRAWYANFVLRFRVSHSQFPRATAGDVSHPTQVRTRGLLCCIRASTRSSERDRLGMSGASESELTGSHLNLCRLFVPPSRVHHNLSRVSLPPPRALSWPLSRKTLQIIYGSCRNDGPRAPILPKTPPEARRYCSDWCVFSACLPVTVY